MLQIPCPGCRKLLQVADTSIDRDSQCPECGMIFRPEAMWRRQSAPSADTTTLELPHHSDASIDEIGALSNDEVPWRSPPIKRPTPVRPRSPNLLRFGTWGFCGGILLSFFFWWQRSFALADLNFVLVLFVSLSATLFVVVYRILDIAALDTWDRWSCRISRVFAAAVFAAATLWALTRHGPPPLGIELVALWACAFLGFGCYFVLAVFGRVGPALAQLMKGFLKAAGRPTTRPSREKVLRKIAEDLDNEDSP
jgi:hypothetical protein